MQTWTKLLSAMVILTAVSVTNAQQGGPGGGPGGPGGGGPGGMGGHGGPPDPEEMRAMMDRHIQHNLNLPDDAWAKLQPLVDKVQELAHETDTGPRMHGPPHPQDDGNGPPDDDADHPKSAVESAVSDLKKVLTDQSSTDEKITAATKAVEDAEKKAAADLTEARKALKAALNIRQTAVLVAMGVLD